MRKLFVMILKKHNGEVVNEIASWSPFSEESIQTSLKSFDADFVVIQEQYHKI